MKLKSFNYLFGLLIIFILFSPLKGEDKIDIWKNNKAKEPQIEKNSSENKKKMILVRR